MLISGALILPKSEILLLSNSVTFKFCYFQILLLSNSLTFKFSYCRAVACMSREDTDEEEAEAGDATASKQPEDLGWQHDQKSDADQRLRRDLVLGRMLSLLCDPRGPLPHALPSLAAQLARLAIIPTWLKVSFLFNPKTLSPKP